MELTGKVTRVPVENINEAGEEETVTFFISLNWGQLKKMMAEMDGLEDDDTIKVLALVERHMLKMIKRIEGLQDAKGDSIISLTPEVFDEFLPDFVMLAWSRITSIGEDTEQGETTVPLVDSTKTEPESSSKPKEQ